MIPSQQNALSPEAAVGLSGVMAIYRQTDFRQNPTAFVVQVVLVVGSLAAPGETVDGQVVADGGLARLSVVTIVPLSSDTVPPEGRPPLCDAVDAGPLRHPAYMLAAVLTPMPITLFLRMGDPGSKSAPAVSIPASRSAATTCCPPLSTAKQITHLRPSTARIFTHPAAKLFTQAEGILAKEFTHPMAR